MTKYFEWTEAEPRIYKWWTDKGCFQPKSDDASAPGEGERPALLDADGLQRKRVLTCVLHFCFCFVSH